MIRPKTGAEVPAGDGDKGTWTPLGHVLCPGSQSPRCWKLASIKDSDVHLIFSSSCLPKKMVPSWGLTWARVWLCPPGLSLRVHHHYHHGSRGVVSERVMFRHPEGALRAPTPNLPLHAALIKNSITLVSYREPAECGGRQEGIKSTGRPPRGHQWAPRQHPYSQASPAHRPPHRCPVCPSQT